MFNITIFLLFELYLQKIVIKAMKEKVMVEVEMKVQIEKNLVGIIVGSVVGGLVLIAAIIIIIIFVKKRKSGLSGIKSTNSEKKILPNSNQIELLEGNNFGNE